MGNVLFDVPREAYSRLLQGLKDGINDRYLVYQDRVLIKPTGRRTLDISPDIPEGFQENFSGNFHKIVQAVHNHLGVCFVGFN